MRLLKNYGQRVARVQTWQLVFALVLFGGLSLYGLRINNQQMAQLKRDVIAADREGEDVYKELSELANHIFHHMNTSTRISLEHTYGRAFDEAVDNAYQDTVDNEILQEATRQCEQSYAPSPQRAACVGEYISQQGSARLPEEPDLPLVADYEYEFVSPRWSPDLAGLSLMASFVSFMWLIGHTIRSLKK